MGSDTLQLRTSTNHGRRARATRVVSALLLGLICTGCHSVRNGWLDPTVLGNFQDSSSSSIRTSLTLEDTPMGVPGASFPVPEDLIAERVEYPIQPGDSLAIEVFALRQRDFPYQAQVLVTPTGEVNLPVVGRIQASDQTVPEFETALIERLRDDDVLLEPEVTVNAIFLQAATFSIFGIGVSASNNAPLRAGTFPIRRPDLRVLEAINDVGGLNEFVTDIYIFRNDNPKWSTGDREATPDADANEDASERDESSPQTAPDEQVAPEAQPAIDAPTDAREQLIDAVIGNDHEADTGDATGDEPEADVLQPSAYVFKDGEFIKNPALDSRVSDSQPRMASPIDTVVPAINWARIAGDSDQRIIHIPADLLRGGDPSANVVVRAGDVIRIVSGEIGVYYVMGQVNRVGAFAFNSEPITLKGAIAAAGGLSALAWPDRCTVYRHIGRREQMIQVDLDSIFAGKDEDFFIKRGDIINVGTHPFAPFLNAIRGISIPNPVSNVGYSFTYARNFADIDSFAVQQNPANRPSRFPALFP